MDNVMFWIKISGPVLGNVLVTLYQRITQHLRSTVQGSTVGVGVFALLESMGCNITLMNEGIISMLAALPSLIGTDANKVAPTLIEVAKDTVENKKKLIVSESEYKRGI